MQGTFVVNDVIVSIRFSFDWKLRGFFSLGSFVAWHSLQWTTHALFDECRVGFPIGYYVYISQNFLKIQPYF